MHPQLCPNQAWNLKLDKAQQPKIRAYFSSRISHDHYEHVPRTQECDEEGQVPAVRVEVEVEEDLRRLDHRHASREVRSEKGSRELFVELERATDLARRPGPEDWLQVKKPNTWYYPSHKLCQARELFYRLSRARDSVIYTPLRYNSKYLKSS